ncbi:hypothetical protein F5882DRAFT_419284 [Hyaloscypha sp. PMI_1271]|nr:hypothetical protein F5882DRAFT_419284 [Hyaloscypha sp. PMI_1271]
MWRYASQLPSMLTTHNPIPRTGQFVPSIMLRLACAMRQPNMPYKKASHRQVRTGCIQCKRRRVKCDERKPRCVNCIRYPSECSFNVVSEGGPEVVPTTSQLRILPKPTASPAPSGHPEFSF